MQRGLSRDECIVEEIRSSLTKSFGLTASRAIDFYADANLALANPEEYASRLLDVFGRGASSLLEAIISGLGDEFGVSTTEATTLGDCIGSLRSAAVASPCG